MTQRIVAIILLLAGVSAYPAQEENDNAASRKVLGSSVVTSVSVIMDSGNEKHFSDAVGKPMSKPAVGSQVASPINLLNPDRYEFYTFDDSGDLVKRLMTLDEIQGIIANGDGEAFNYNSQSPYLPEKKVNDVVNNVQNVLKTEMESHKNTSDKPVLDTPDVSSSWSMILPAIFGNSGEQIKPNKPQSSMTPETIMVEPQNVPIVHKPKPFTPAEIRETTQRITTTKIDAPIITVAIVTKLPKINDTFVTKKPTTSKKPFIRPQLPIEATKDNGIKPQKRPIIKPSTYRPTSFKIPSTTNVYTKPVFTPTPSTKRVVVTTTTPTTAVRTTTTTTTPKPTTTTFKPKTTRTTTTTTTTPKPTTTTRRTTTTRKPTTTTSTTTPKPTTQFLPISTKFEAQASQFIQLFDPSTTPKNKPTTQNIEQPVNKIERPTLNAVNDFLIPPSFPSSVFIVDHKTNTRIPITTKEQLTTLLNSLPHESTTEQLRTSSTTNKYTTQQHVATTTNQKPLHIQPTLTTSSAITTNYPSETTELDKISVPEILDQLLLTSTNIYEINTELEDKVSTIPQTTDNLIATTKEITNSSKEAESTTMEQSTDSLITTTLLDESTRHPLSTLPQNVQDVIMQVQNTEGDRESTTVPFPTTTNDITTDLPTTENIINSIEALIQQAVGNLAEAISDDESDVDKVDEMVSNVNDKPMSVVQMESATAASSLLDYTTTDSPTITLNDDALSEAVDSLLSQVVSSDLEGLTTLQELPSTTEILGKTTMEFRHNPTDIMSESTEAVKTEESTTDVDKLVTTTSIETTTEVLTTPQKSTNQPEDKSDSNEILNSEATSYTEREELTTEEVVQTTTESIDTSTIRDYTKPITVQTTSKYDDVKKTEVTSTTEAAAKTNETSKQPEETTTTNNEINMVKLDAISNTPYSLDSTTVTEIATEPPKVTISEEIPKESTIVAIITKAAAKLETTPQPATPKTPLLKPDVKKDDSNWSLVPTISPHNKASTASPEIKPQINVQPAKPVELVPQPQQYGLEDSTAHLDPDIYQFVALCNELAFGFWNSVNNGISAARSVFVSPFAATSLLAMVFLGARGATSGEMNEILRLDDMVTFNPHLIFKNVTESIDADTKSGVATSVIVRELYSDKGKGDLLNFYKERARQFYDGHVEEVSFKEVGDVIRRRSNLIVKRQTKGKIQEYIKDSSITVKSPLAGVSISIFQTDCSAASTEGRDGELYFVVLPSIRQRRLIPVPAAVWRTGFLAGYEPALDATAVAIGNKDQVISTLFVIPGQQGIAAPGDGLARLERHLVNSAFKENSWSRLLKSVIPRPGLEVQIPRFSHRSIINATVALQHMGMKDLFDSEKADLRGLNGVANDLYLSDILQINNFATCGEDNIGDAHHSEIYPATANRTYRRSRKFKDVLQPEDAYYDSELLEEPRDYQRAFHDPLHDPTLFSLPLPLRPRQARLPEPPRLRFDRPFLYFVRHNPTGLILHMGRFNPRLLP